MTKAEMVSRIAQDASISQKAAEGVIASVLLVIQDSLKETKEIRIDGLGTFRVSERKARKGVNPQTGATIQIPATKAVGFRPAKTLKEAVNQGA